MKARVELAILIGKPTGQCAAAGFMLGAIALQDPKLVPAHASEDWLRNCAQGYADEYLAFVRKKALGAVTAAIAESDAVFAAFIKIKGRFDQALSLYNGAQRFRDAMNGDVDSETIPDLVDLLFEVIEAGGDASEFLDGL